MNPLNVIEAAASGSPVALEAVKALKIIISNPSRWQDAFIEYINSTKDDMSNIVALIKPGTKSRQFIDKQLPGFVVRKIETIVNELAAKQAGSSRQSGAGASTYNPRAGYRILPINK